MSEEHRAILGVGLRAGAAEIREAYRRKAKLAHPDLGGTNEAFLRVRAAADALLAELRLVVPHAPSPPPPANVDRHARGGHWMTVVGELGRVWGLCGKPTMVIAPAKFGLSPFVAGDLLNLQAYHWLTSTLGPRGETWDFHVDDTVARLFFRSPDDARVFRLRFS